MAATEILLEMFASSYVFIVAGELVYVLPVDLPHNLKTLFAAVDPLLG